MSHVLHTEQLNLKLTQSQNYCEYCGKIVEGHKVCCDKFKLKKYLSELEEKRLIQSISSYSLLNLKESDIPVELKKLEDLHKKISMIK